MEFSFKDYLESIKSKNDEKDSLRKTNTRKLRQFILIVCEGTKTEPNYFEAIKNKLPRGSVDKLTIKGLGRNTTSLIDAAIVHVEHRKESTQQNFDQVWIVFDRDSFTKNQVNTANTRIMELGFHSAFSNEAFELWYILHFEYLDAKIDRKSYIKNLNRIFKKLDLGKYAKNSENMYDTLQEYGNEQNAISYANKLLNLHEGKTAFDSQPSTKVHLLITELNKYM